MCGTKALPVSEESSTKCRFLRQRELPFIPLEIFPSAYQIRLAGCKGLLIVEQQSTLEQFYVKIRPSMEKFYCDEWTLDIRGYSQPSTVRFVTSS